MLCCVLLELHLLPFKYGNPDLLLGKWGIKVLFFRISETSIMKKPWLLLFHLTKCYCFLYCLFIIYLFSLHLLCMFNWHTSVLICWVVREAHGCLVVWGCQSHLSGYWWFISTYIAFSKFLSWWKLLPVPWCCLECIQSEAGSFILSFMKLTC